MAINSYDGLKGVDTLRVLQDALAALKDIFADSNDVHARIEARFAVERVLDSIIETQNYRTERKAGGRV
jgi:hypothetical protein